MHGQQKKGVRVAYWCALALVIVASIAVRVAYASWYPFGYSGHALFHYRALRLPLYQVLFHGPWNEPNISLLLEFLLNNQHGPQSFIEALLTPLFGFGLTESRLLVASLGLFSILTAIYWGSLAFNRWFGLAVGIAVSFAPYHLIFSLDSESEHVNVFWCTFLLLSVAQLVLQRGRPVHFFLLGLFTALTAYVYAPTILLGALVTGLLIVFSGNPLKVPTRLLCERLAAYLLPLATLFACIVVPALAAGKAIPIRIPSDSQDYELISLERLGHNLGQAFKELFIVAADPWFQRPVGALADPTMLLVIPGALLLIAWGNASVQCLRDSTSTQLMRWSSRGRMFAVACVLALTVFGLAPGILSPQPHFRRLILAGLGVTILEGAGLYAISAVMLRLLGRVAGGAVALAAAAAYGYVGWHAFRYDVQLQDNLPTFQSVEIVREASRRASKGEGTVILLPQNTQKLYLDEVTSLLRVEYGFDEAVPPGIKTIFLSSAIEGPMEGVFLPSDVFREIESGALPKPQHFSITNPRPVRNVEQEVFVVVDLVPNR